MLVKPVFFIFLFLTNCLICTLLLLYLLYFSQWSADRTNKKSDIDILWKLFMTFDGCPLNSCTVNQFEESVAQSHLARSRKKGDGQSPFSTSHITPSTVLSVTKKTVRCLHHPLRNIMHLPKESDDCSNSTTTGIQSAFSWDSRDTRADDLPMMESIAWPLGEY